MKHLLLILFIGLIGTTQAGILEEVYMPVLLKSTSQDATLKSGDAKYTFEFSTLDGSSPQIIYSIDGVEESAVPTDNSIEIITAPGKHIFQFYYSENYYEVYSDSLEIQSQFHSIYVVYMERADIQIMVDKPVIYLYPEKETDVDVKVNVQGNSTFFYPEYNGSWKFTAFPSGELKFGKNLYNYLFWEAAQSTTVTSEELKTGFVVKQENVVSFLEEKLTLAGLNSKEQADFITYWGPRLAANPLNFVRFEFNETCDRYAELEIEPTPQEVYRIYISWMKIDAALEVKKQEIPTFKREGFSVLEWGGYEIQTVARRSGHAVK